MTNRLLFLLIAFFGLVVLVAGGLGFIYSGIYPIAADRPHIPPVHWALTTMQENAVARHSRGVEPPELRSAALVRAGLPIYQRECVICHGAPGIERPQIGRGLNPNPPRLAVEVVEWDDSELWWIIKHGLKMAGMPSFDTGYSDEEIWAVTAFVRRLPELTVADYQAMVAAAEGRTDPVTVAWIAEEDPGFGEMVANADFGRGRALLGEYGCGSCHLIPGVQGARGMTGPPLERWAERHYIAGSRLNTPRELVGWIIDPASVEPGTAMPALGVTPAEALDMAAYLFTLGDPPLRLLNMAARGR